MIREIAEKAGSHAQAKILASSVLDECAKLQKVDVVEASLLKANIYALTGEIAEVERWIRNAEQNYAAPERVAAARELVYFLTGQISKAAPYFAGVLRTHAGDPVAVFNKCMATAWFEKAVSVIEMFPAVPWHGELVDLARRAWGAAQALKLDEGFASAVMDQVHGIMVNRGLIWLDVTPTITVLDELHGGPLIHISYRVAETPRVAAELSWELAERLAARDLENRGLLVSYHGVKLGTVTVDAPLAVC